MSHYVFTDSPQAPYPIAILIKELAFNKPMLEKYYVDPLEKRGVPREDCLALPLKYTEKNKCTISMAKEWLENILKWLTHFKTEYLLVTDPVYFKALTKVGKVEPHHGYVLPCKMKGFEHFNVIYSVNFSALFYNPKLGNKLEMSLNTLQQHYQCIFTPLGHDIIHSESYPEKPAEVAEALKKLHQYPSLTCDAETLSLEFYTAGIGTIAFSWDKHNGLAIPIDTYGTEPKILKGLLRDFFKSYEGILIFHGGTFDIRVLVYELFMDSLDDIAGMLEGIAILTKNTHDTKIIAYLATNTTAGNKLDLKSLAHEFAGNYAQDEIKDITKIPKEDLLRYNLVDCLATWYVFDKYYPIMIKDKQEEIYKEIFLPSMEVIIQMELTGMPLDMDEVARAKEFMQGVSDKHEAVLRGSFLVTEYENILQKRLMDTANAKLKTKVKTIDEFSDEKFNPNSGPQIREMIYDQWGFEPIDFTDTGLPATGAETLEKLLAGLINTHNLTEEELK